MSQPAESLLHGNWYYSCNWYKSYVYPKHYHAPLLQIPDIALITPCGTLHTLLREENENYHEMSVDTPTVPPSDLSLIQYIQAHVQWYNTVALVSSLVNRQVTAKCLIQSRSMPKPFQLLLKYCLGKNV